MKECGRTSLTESKTVLALAVHVLTVNKQMRIREELNTNAISHQTSRMNNGETKVIQNNQK
jgi:hypothetical protein